VLHDFKLRNPLSVELCLNLMEKLTALSRPPNWIWGGDPWVGIDIKRKEGKREEGKEEGKKGGEK